MAMSKDYLESLSKEAAGNQDLALEIGEAYSLLARAQGISIVSNLGQLTQAEESLRKAEAIIEPGLKANPNNRKALFAAANVSHDRTVLAEADQRHDEATIEARKTVAYLERLLVMRPLSAAESEIASALFYDLGIAYKNLHLLDDAVHCANRSIEISRSLVNAQFRLSLATSLLADLLRLSGRLDEALQAVRESRESLSSAQFSSEIDRRSSWFTVLWREGKILGAVSGLSLNRFDEATVVLQRAFKLVEEWSQNDREDAWSRLFFASVGRELGDLLSRNDPRKALAVYDHALLRLGEIKDNSEARRGEAEILARSAYALRRLNEPGTARNKIDAAFRLLNEVREYPADQVVLHTGADTTIRALGDHLAETGQIENAIGVYEDLLKKVIVSKPDSRNDLRHAVGLSDVYSTLTTLYRRNRQFDRAEDMSSLRQELWRHWKQKLPGNALIQRQFNTVTFLSTK